MRRVKPRSKLWNIGCRRQSKKEDAAVVQFAFGPDRAAVYANDVLGDCQSQPGAAALARTRFVNAVKTLEQPRQMLRGYPWAVVVHKEFDGAFQVTRADFQAASRR